MQFSVIIPTCNRNDLLSQCLDLLHPQYQSTQFEYEVIVTDDGAEDNAKSLTEERYPWVKWTKGPQRGPASNRNNGAKYAKGNWLIFLDDDCLPQQDLLKNYHLYISEYPLVNVFEGKISNDKPKKSPLEYAPLNMKGGELWSCNFAINKSTFFSIQGFDENYQFPHMEDIDLKDRLITAREPIQFCETAEVIHPWRKVTDGRKLGKYQAMYYYYYSKKNKKPKVQNLLKDIFFTHLSMMKGTKPSIDTFIAIKVLLEHLITVVFNYKKWEKKYVGES